VWDDEGDRRRLLGTVRVPKGVSPQEYIADARRLAARLRIDGGEGTLNP